mgnify:CR=1 FL=1
MINKKKSTKKNDTSNSMVIKVMLLGFLGGNMIYAVIAFLMGDMPVSYTHLRAHET